MEEAIRMAIREARLAYKYDPGSYAYSCLGACLAILGEWKRLEEIRRAEEARLTSEASLLEDYSI